MRRNAAPIRCSAMSARRDRATSAPSDSTPCAPRKEAAGPHPVIASPSQGAVRLFRLRRASTRPSAGPDRRRMRADVSAMRTARGRSGRAGSCVMISIGSHPSLRCSLPSAGTGISHFWPGFLAVSTFAVDQFQGPLHNSVRKTSLHSGADTTTTRPGRSARAAPNRIHRRPAVRHPTPAKYHPRAMD